MSTNVPDSQPSVIPPLPTQPAAPVATRRTGGGGGNGCIYGLIGCLGMAFLLIGVLGAALVATGTTINNFFGGLGGLFNVSSSAPDTRRFVVPQVEPFTLLSSLTTITFNYSNAVGVATDMPAMLQSLYGTSQVLIAVGSIEAGVDLSQLTQSSMTYNEETNVFRILLPGARISNCYLNDQKTYVAERTSGMFATDNIALDTESRRFALQEFLRLAQEANIVAEAEARAEVIVKNFAAATLGEVGDDVLIEVISGTPDTTLPDTCQ